MIRHEGWYREAAGEAELSALVQRKQRGEDVDNEIKALARRLGYPSIVPRQFYVNWWHVANMAYGNPETLADLPGLFRAVYPDFSKELWTGVRNWDPRQLKEFFENDRVLEGHMERSWDEGPDFEEQVGYRGGFFEAVEFVVKELGPLFDSIFDQIERRGYVSQPSMENMTHTLAEYEKQNPHHEDGHQGIIEEQMRATQLQSEYLLYVNMAISLLHEFGPTTGILEEFEDIPQEKELKAWLDEMWKVTYQVLDKSTSTPGPTLTRLKEMGKEWSETWLPLIEEFEKEKGINRFDYHEEDSDGY